MDAGSKKIFPIKNDSACVFKWGWNTFRLYNGKSSSCHRIEPVFVPLEDFENFHNTPEVLNDRRLMLEGQWPTGRGCEYCKDVESAGGISDRLFHNDISGLTPVDFDNGALSVTPSILEIYLDNTCDLACLYCAPNHSSRINAELKKYGPMPIGIQPINKIENRDLYFKKFINWLDEHSHKLKRLAIQGGEPLLQKELWELLEFLKTKKNPNLELSINTNLNSKLSTVEKYVDCLESLLVGRHISRADISCSIDCWGPQQEFIRDGLNLSQWETNFVFLLSKKWLKLSMHHVITALSLSTVQELQDRVVGWKQIQPKLLQEYYLVDGPTQQVYHPKFFGKEFFSDTLNKLLDTYPIMTDYDRVCKSRLDGIVKLLGDSETDAGKLAKLKLTLEEIDRRRGTNWKTLFPDIVDFFEKHRI